MCKDLSVELGHLSGGDGFDDFILTSFSTAAVKDSGVLQHYMDIKTMFVSQDS